MSDNTERLLRQAEDASKPKRRVCNDCSANGCGCSYCNDRGYLTMTDAEFREYEYTRAKQQGLKDL